MDGAGVEHVSLAPHALILTSGFLNVCKHTVNMLYYYNISDTKPIAKASKKMYLYPFYSQSLYSLNTRDFADTSGYFHFERLYNYGRKSL